MDHYVFKKYGEIPSSLRKKLRSLSFRNEGCMCDALRDLSNGAKGSVSVVMEGNKVVSWAVKSNKQFYTLQAYTRKTHRNRGYGAMAAKPIASEKDTVYTSQDDFRTYKHGITSELRKHFWNKVVPSNRKVKK